MQLYIFLALHWYYQCMGYARFEALQQCIQCCAHTIACSAITSPLQGHYMLQVQCFDGFACARVVEWCLGRSPSGTGCLSEVMGAALRT
jgi:hypothetical protein